MAAAGGDTAKRKACADRERAVWQAELEAALRGVRKGGFKEITELVTQAQKSWESRCAYYARSSAGSNPARCRVTRHLHHGRDGEPRAAATPPRLGGERALNEAGRDTSSEADSRGTGRLRGHGLGRPTADRPADSQCDGPPGDRYLSTGSCSGRACGPASPVDGDFKDRRRPRIVLSASGLVAFQA